MANEPAEDDPKYAVKKWGPDYREKPEYWEWLRAREVRQEATSEPEVRPFGWGGNIRPPTRGGGW